MSQSEIQTALPLLQQGRLAEAEQILGALLARQPDNFDALHLSGILALQMGQAEAAAARIARAIAVQPGFAPAHVSLGSALRALHRPAEALASFERALAAPLQRADADALNGRGLALCDLERGAEALESFNAALALEPNHAEAMNNRAIVLKALGRLEEALASLDRSLVLEPRQPQAQFNRGLVLRDLGRAEDALAAFEQALAVKPDFAEAMVSAALLLCEGDRIDDGLALFRRHAELTRDAQVPVTPHKARHDREQRAYLAARNIAAPFHIDPGTRLEGPAINPANDAHHIARQWRAARPQLVVIDNVLTDAALAGLRRFCAESTIWRKSYDGGYLGAIPEHGFACPLLAQIAQEFRAAFPALFGALPLRYLWGFKCDSSLKGVNIHADFAAVNVNFWITSDEANRDPAGGGLIVWDAAAPLDWDFTRYNNDETAIREFLARSGAANRTVPYRANRAVIFDSDLFHETDRIAFHDGYANRRINITMLYGRRKSPDGRRERRI